MNDTEDLSNFYSFLPIILKMTEMWVTSLTDLTDQLAHLNQTLETFLVDEPFLTKFILVPGSGEGLLWKIWVRIQCQRVSFCALLKLSQCEFSSK